MGKLENWIDENIDALFREQAGASLPTKKSLRNIDSLLKIRDSKNHKKIFQEQMV